LEYGLLVAINTDNPIISNTNLVREYFQASYAYDDKGLSVWEALRVMRMGYVCSFLRLPERRAMIETVEQFLFDLFSREDCVAYLREIADLQRSRRKDARIKPPEAGGRA
jgi:adenosine deaminase